MRTIAYRPNFETMDAELPERDWLGTGAARPADNFVVGYCNDGSVASRYGNMTWDFNAYAHGKTDAKLSFTFWCNGNLDDRRLSLIDEVKWLTFCNIWKRTGTTLAISTHKLLHLTACRVAAYAYDNNTSVKDLLSDAALFTQMARSVEPALARNIRHLLFSLNLVEPDELGFKLADKSTQQVLERSVPRKLSEQTAPIPTRIYSKLLSSISLQLSETEQHIDRLLAFCVETSSHPLCGRSLATQRIYWEERTGKRLDFDVLQLDFEALTRKHDLSGYFSAYDVCNVKQVSSRLSTIQTLCKLAIHAYSGMRDNEVEMLPYGCLVTERLSGQVHNLIVGKTFKFSSGLGRRAKWVVVEDAACGVRLAQRLSKCVMKIAGLNSADEDAPLFISLLYLNLGNKRIEQTAVSFRRAVDLHLKNRLKWLESFDLQITEDDVHELNNLDPFRDWERKSYVPGNRWPLATHQLRRSLALYASRSGLVSLPSLRRQLQHITQEMSLYYARGSHFAKNFTGDTENIGQRHFAMEVQETAAESEMLSFLVNVIKGDEQLFGGQGAFWQRQKEKGNSNISQLNREKTLKEFREGRRSFQVTPLGGCGKVGECNERAMGSFMGCIFSDQTAPAQPKPCRYSYISESRLENVITSQEDRLVKEAQLGTNTMYYKETLDDLNILKTYRARISTH